MNNKPKRITQYIGALGATFGGFALGTTIGWSSPANAILKEKNFSTEEMTWISSIMPIGAAFAQIYMALTLDFFGHKKSMILIALPFIAGWIIIAFAESAQLLYAGRFITGFCGGSFCVAAPTYIAEIADKDIRGTLSVFFQLLITIGILVGYTLGLFENMLVLTLPLCSGPLIVFIVMILLPESPVFLYRNGNVERAKEALRFYRGPQYNIDPEIKEIEDYTKKNDESFWKQFNTRASKQAFLMLLGMHIVQQLTGINAVMFYAHSIFSSAGSKLGPKIDSIVLAVVQVVMTSVSAYLIDRMGRKVLWIASLSLMGICLLIMGIFYHIQNTDPNFAKKLALLPLIVICIYLAGFSLGTGPLPWVMIGEFLPNSVKCYVGPFIAFFNWMLAFLITTSFNYLIDMIGSSVVFLIFAFICLIGLFFVIFYVIETRQKTLEDIQIMLEN